MGGKHKQANRTKNNTRPSSSSHSAELLGNTIPTFFGFSSTVKSGLAHLPGFTSDESACSVNSDFQVLFKQMNKKDPITRYKALQQYIDLVNNSDSEEVKIILPLWPRLYIMLCTDVDHKVREISHKAHKAVVGRVKKFIAPYLKEIAGPWFTSQYDTYAPAASAAMAAFEEAFPAAKLNKAIVFCQEEILSYIYDNLINQTPQSLSSQISLSPENMQAKYERTILASLQGYSLYLKKLSAEQIKEAEESNRKLLSHSKFWSYAKHKMPLIRSSFFHVLISLCQNAEFLLAEKSTHLSSIVFNNLEDSDPIVLQAVWDAAVNILVTLEDCWSHIKIEKQLCMKLYSLLKGGGRNVFGVYPSVLPLLSKIPENALNDKESFYEKLFESMRSGFEAVTYAQNSSEAKLMASTFIECLKFVIKRNSSQEGLCLSLMSNQLMPVLDKLLAGKYKASLKLPLQIQISYLIRYWLSNEFPDDDNIYEKLSGQFYESLLIMCEKQIGGEIARSLEIDLLKNQIQFLNILHHPNNFERKNKGHVKFEEETQLSVDSVQKKNEKIETESPERLVRYAKKLASIYFLNAVNKEEKNYLVAIADIANMFDVKIIFEELTAVVNESTCFKLFSSYFSKWLMREDMKCKELVDLSFFLLDYVTDDEKEYILDEFCGNWLSDSLRLDVCRSLMNYSYDDCVIKWVKDEKFTNNLLGLVERVLDAETENSEPRNVIVQLLKAKNRNGEFIVDASTVDLIMNLLSLKLEKSHAIELSKDLILNADTKHLGLPSFSKLIISLFKLSCYKSDSAKLSKACRAGLEIILSARQHFVSDFSKDLANAVKEIIVGDKFKYSLEQVVANVSAFLELAVELNARNSTDGEYMITLAKICLAKAENDDTWSRESFKTLEKCCLVAFEGNSDLDYAYLQQQAYNLLEETPCVGEKKSSYDITLIRKCVKWNTYVGSILNLIFGKIRFETLPENLDCDGVERRIKKVIVEIKDLLLCYGLVECFNIYHCGTKYFKCLDRSTAKLRNVVKDLLDNLTEAERECIRRHCSTVYGYQSVWWTLKPTFVKLFGEDLVDFADESEDLKFRQEKSLRELEETNISKLPTLRGNCFVITHLIDEFGHRLNEKKWDEIFIYLHNFVEEFLEKSQFSENDLLVLLAFARLYLKLKQKFRNNHTKPYESRICPDTCLVWNEVVELEVYNRMFSIWRKLAKSLCDEKEVPPEWIIALQTISDVVIDGLDKRKNETVEKSVELVMECTRLFRSFHAVIQITSFRISLGAIPELVKADAEKFGDNMSKMFHGDEGNSFVNSSNNAPNDNWTIKNLRHEIEENQSIVETILSDFVVGDHCTVEPFTDSFTYTYSYLLIWYLLLNACGEAHSSLRVQYGAWFRESSYASALIESVFKLMPESVLHGTTVNETLSKYFECYESLDFREVVGSHRIEQSACMVYRLFLQRLPNYVREWWKQVENKVSSLVDNVTKLYVSPILISNELKNVLQDKETGFDNIEIKTYPGSREVVATYTIDEVKMDLIMILPPNYPLETAKIESSNVVVGTSKWRNLLFQICKYLIHQNGTVWDALVIWKNNLDKKFEGVEECYICFSILMGSSFELPRLCCHTCKKKFHSNCLYKWFSTSNNSTCPICRNLF